MRSSFADRGRFSLGRAWPAILIAGGVLIASFIVMLASLAVVGLTDDHSADLRREVLEHAFYLTKIQVQLDFIADYRPDGTPDKVRQEINRLRFPLSAHMGMYFRPEIQEAMLAQATVPSTDLQKLRDNASKMWDVYLELRRILEQASQSPDPGEQASLMREARQKIDAWYPPARHYNDALFVLQASVLARLEQRVATSSRVAASTGGLAIVATALVVILLVRWMIRERRHRRELEAARKDADRANRAKAVFLTTLSHELRTPLHGMFGLMELVERDGLSDHQREHLRLLRSTTNGLLHHFEGLLDLSAVEAGEVRPRRSPVRLRESLAGVVEAARHAARAKGLRFTVTWPDDDRPRLLDPVRVGQVVTNLASNAVEYTSDGFVDLAFGLAEERLTIVVRDSGIGIAEADRERVFEMFVQADEGHTRSHGGTGAGLAIVRRLVDALGGGVELDSKVGGGSTFTVTLPAPLSTAEEAEEQAGPTDSGRAQRSSGAPGSDGAAKAADLAVGRTVRVLVAEDEAINRLYLRMVLEGNEFLVTEVGTGPEALEALRDGTQDIGLLDISMPGMSGLDVARGLREEQGAGEGRRVPLIALTAHAQAEDREACLAAGFDDYLTKPFDEQTLLARMESLLSLVPLE